MQLTIAFEAFFPVARWGPMFHVLCLEQPLLTLEWQPVRLPTVGRSPLGDAEVGLLVEPLVGPGLESLTIDSSPMVATMAVGHPLACHDEISVADILDSGSSTVRTSTRGGARSGRSTIAAARPRISSSRP